MNDLLTPDELHALAVYRSLSAYQRYMFKFWMRRMAFTTMLWLLIRIHDDPEHLLDFAAPVGVDEATFGGA